MSLPYKIATLLYCFNERDEILLLERAQEPNRGLWSPCGGKLKTDLGESPYACAAREAHEEMGVQFAPSDFHLAGLVSEHGFQGQAHWLMFLFELKPKLKQLPPPMSEGRFEFFPREKISSLKIPQTDREKIWPWFWQFRGGFFSAHCHCHADGRNEWTLEENYNRGKTKRHVEVFDQKTARRAQQLGTFGEDLAEKVLRESGFRNIKNLNNERLNFPFADFYAERHNEKYIISVKSRNRRTNEGKLNTRYILGKHSYELAKKAQKEISAVPAFLAVSVLPQVYSAYFAPLDILKGNLGIPMTPTWISRYECLAEDKPHNTDISHLKNTYR